jgi:hypothetical protein
MLSDNSLTNSRPKNAPITSGIADMAVNLFAKRSSPATPLSALLYPSDLANRFCLG